MCNAWGTILSVWWTMLSSVILNKSYIDELVRQHHMDVQTFAKSANIDLGNQDDERREFIEERRRHWENKDVEDGEQSCAICLVPYEKDCVITELDCKHIFHEKCLDDHLKSKASEYEVQCPLCRTKLGL